MRLLIVRLFAIIALGLSFAIFLEERRISPAFCSAKTGCQSVLGSEWSSPAGVPLPVVGMLGFGALILATLFPGASLGKLVRPLAIAGGIAGAGLLAVQFAILRQYCVYCLMIDNLAIAAMLASFLLPIDKTSAPKIAIWGPMATLAIVLPWSWAMMIPEATPPDWVRAHFRVGEITVVEVSDFGCHHCQAQSEVMRRFRESHPEFHYVRIVAPDEREAKSWFSAKLYAAMERQRNSSVEGAEIYRADVTSMKRAQEFGSAHGFDVAKLEADMASPDLMESLRLNSKRLFESPNGILPQTWINEFPLFGGQTEEALELAARRSKNRLRK